MVEVFKSKTPSPGTVGYLCHYLANTITLLCKSRKRRILTHESNFIGFYRNKVGIPGPLLNVNRNHWLLFAVEVDHSWSVGVVIIVTLGFFFLRDYILNVHK